MSDQPELDFPDVYTSETWPKTVKTPMAWVNEVKQLLSKIAPLKDTYTAMSTNPLGPFQYMLKVSLGNMTAEYTPSKASRTQKEAKQNAALQFVLFPPIWLKEILNGDIPEGFSLESTSAPSGQVLKSKASAERGFDIVPDLASEPGTIDLQQFKQKSSQFPDFSFAKFESDRAANPSSFHDVFGDGKLLIQELATGRNYPETDGILTIKCCVKRQSDGQIIHSELSKEINPVEFELPFYYWGSTFLRVGGEILIYATCDHAYLDCGVPGFIGPNEPVLAYIKLLRADLFKPKSQDDGENYDTKLLSAVGFKNTAKQFLDRKLFKLAIDCYVRASRLLSKSMRAFWSIPAEKRPHLFVMMHTLYSNLSIIYQKMQDNKMIKFYCDKAIEVGAWTPKVFLRRAKLYIVTQRFDQAIGDINSAKKLIFCDDIDPIKQSCYVDYLAKIKEYLIAKKGKYEAKRIAMEARMGAGFLQGGWKGEYEDGQEV